MYFAVTLSWPTGKRVVVCTAVERAVPAMGSKLPVTGTGGESSFVPAKNAIFPVGGLP
jgi:hypothetical protein